MLWFNKNKTNPTTDSIKIDRFLNRGIENIYPSKDFLRARLLEGKALKMYLGIDPTAPTLHLGHAIVLKKLKEFQDLGHEAILLIGDFTGMIGDPTDKTATRKKLTREQVLENARVYKEQASNFLKFDGDNPAQIKYNSKWLSRMDFGDVLELSSLVTVEQMLKRDMFDRRIKEGRPIYIHEFMYPLMQGFDSVFMGVDGEIGGNDQTFNMLMGRDLLKVMKNKEKFVISTKLLTDSEGKKMGKTEGNMVSLDQDAKEMFGKIMSWSDNLIIPGFELCTYSSEDDLARVKEDMDRGVNPKDLKVRLAKEIVSIYHGVEKANNSASDFERTFSKKELPDDIKEVSVSKGKLLADILTDEGLVKSKSEFKRLVEEGAVSIQGGEVVKDMYFAVENNTVFKIGKRRFIKINIR